MKWERLLFPGVLIGGGIMLMGSHVPWYDPWYDKVPTTRKPPRSSEFDNGGRQVPPRGGADEQGSQSGPQEPDPEKPLDFDNISIPPEWIVGGFVLLCAGGFLLYAFSRSGSTSYATA